MNPPLENYSPSPIAPFGVHTSDSLADSSDPFTELVAASTIHAPRTDPPRGVVPFAPAGDFVRFYGLRENPFADSIHPGFFFRTDGHAEAFRNMMLAVDFQTALGLVTGESGTGKTLVTQLLLQHFDEAKYRAALILVTPGLSKTGLLREILSELNLALPVGVSRVQDLVKLLSNHIIELHGQGRHLVILIDECHLLSADCLHVIRTLSNIETPRQKLVTCLLFGEARFAQRIQHPSYDALRNRIYLRGTLEALTAAEAAQYVKFRLMSAGRLQDLFTEGALTTIHQHSQGICRNVNKLAMLSLIEGAQAHLPSIDEAVVAAAAKRM
jgi:general secretion pathway protein A